MYRLVLSIVIALILHWKGWNNTKINHIYSCSWLEQGKSQLISIDSLKFFTNKPSS